jgi:trimethylamine-N-oxide reductase (cytochrome c)
VSTVHCNGGGYIRSAFSHEPARLEVALLAMQGVGAPGRAMFKMIEWNMFGMARLNPIPNPEWGTYMAGAYTGHLAGTDLGPGHFEPQTMTPNAILLPEGEKLEWYGRVVCSLPLADQYKGYEFPGPEGQRIHMVWSDTPCWSTCWNGGNRMQDALRSPEVEFYLVQHPWMENDTMFADIVLPVTTKFEEEDIETSQECGVSDLVIHELAAIEPVGEAKSDSEAVLAIAEKLGLRDRLMKHWCYPDNAHMHLGIHDGSDDDPNAAASVAHEFGEPSFETLKKCGYFKGGVHIRMPYEEFLEKGYLPARFKDNWEDDEVGMTGFYNDPDNNPLDTPTGKIEFYSTGIANHWPNDQERRPVPHWIEESDSHHERLTCDRGKTIRS